LPDHISEIVDVWLNEEMEDFGDPMENSDSYGLCNLSMDFIQLSLICVQNKIKL
jgi:hypothetical protein